MPEIPQLEYLSALDLVLDSAEESAGSARKCAEGALEPFFCLYGPKQERMLAIPFSRIRASELRLWEDAVVDGDLECVLVRA